MLLSILSHFHATHYSQGPFGFVEWIQSAHMSAGIGVIKGHLITWWETR